LSARAKCRGDDAITPSSETAYGSLTVVESAEIKVVSPDGTPSALRGKAHNLLRTVSRPLAPLRWRQTLLRILTSSLFEVI
jgi:hypothetical protein